MSARWDTDRVAIQSELASSFEVAEVETPFSPNETGPIITYEERRQARMMAMAAPSLPNPQTPPSANESDPSHLVDEMIAHREQVAQIEQTRIALASAIGTTAGTLEERSVARADPAAPDEPTSLREGPQPIARLESTPPEREPTPSEPSSAATNEVVVQESQHASITTRELVVPESESPLTTANELVVPGSQPPATSESVPGSESSGMTEPTVPESQSSVTSEPVVPEQLSAMHSERFTDLMPPERQALTTDTVPNAPFAPESGIATPSSAPSQAAEASATAM
jgi:hypothetical protein